MDAITAWFQNSKEYHSGVALYAALPTKKIHILKKLNKGKNNRNMSLLVSILRKEKHAPLPEPEPLLIIEKPKNPDQEHINLEHIQQQITVESTKREFEGIRLGDLPAELRKSISLSRLWS